MPSVFVPFEKIDSDSRAQLEYALSFVSEEVLSYRINEADSLIEAEVATEQVGRDIVPRIEELVRRYQKREFGLAKTTDFQQDRELPLVDAWSELIQRKWITPVGEGHVILRGPAAQVAGLVDGRIDRLFATHAEREYYPGTILSRTLDRIHHFTSFPEHVDFVSHLKPDLGVINGFSAECKERGWSAQLHESRMADHDFAICPSCCYHCYEGMEGWDLDAPGRTVTATLACHRYEGANHRTMSRLRAFTMREVIWIGRPDFVLNARASAEEAIIQWAKDWELSGTLETANDMFFTDDYAVKASFQRQQKGKKELRLTIPNEKQSISVFSSNFHAMTFGKAFNISSGGRPATSGCVGWGIERWVYAVFSQFGFDFSKWPLKAKEEFDAYTADKRDR